MSSIKQPNQKKKEERDNDKKDRSEYSNRTKESNKHVNELERSLDAGERAPSFVPDLPESGNEQSLLYTRQFTSIHSMNIALRFSEYLLFEQDRLIKENIPKWHSCVVDDFEMDIKCQDNSAIINRLSPLFDKMMIISKGNSSISKTHFFGYKNVCARHVDLICAFEIADCDLFKCLKVHYLCDRDAAGYVEKIKEVFEPDRCARETVHQVEWTYTDSQGHHNSFTLLEEFKEVLLDAAYPFLPGSVDDFVEDYLRSDEPVLVLTGPPGTGKTRLIRYICQKMQLNRTDRICYSMDAAVLKTDNLFIKYMTDESARVMILEDMDFSLRSRKDDNPEMYRLLGCSDGFIQGTLHKKLIISTNAQMTNIDEALIRAGRCYATVPFRKLTHMEAGQVLNQLMPGTIKYENIIDENLTYSLSMLYLLAGWKSGKVSRKMRTISKSSLYNIGFL